MSTVYYKIVDLNQYLADAETDLNTYGADGWELSAIYNTQAILISGSGQGGVGTAQLDQLIGTTFSASNFTFPQNLTVAGTLTAEVYATEYVSASIIFESGSTQFGNSSNDTHIFTGSMLVNGPVTSSQGFFGTASYATTAGFALTPAGSSGTSGQNGSSGTSGNTGATGAAGAPGADSIVYTFDNTLTDSNPVVGFARLNSNDRTLVTEAYISKTSNSGADATAWLNSLVASTNTPNKSIITFGRTNDFAYNYARYYVTGLTDATGYVKLALTYIDHIGTLNTTGANLLLGASRIGDAGVVGSSGTSGVNGSSGTSGETGSSGTSGSSGEAGSSGTSGETGSSGTSGETGSSGTSGSSGESGTLTLSGTTDNGVLTLNGSSPNASVESTLTFDGNELTVGGDIFLSSSFPLVYNDNDTNNMLFGFFDGSTIHGAYYQIFGNNYVNVSQRGGAEFVYDTRNGGDANFHVSSYDGNTWVQQFRVDVGGAEVTGSLEVTGGITGSLLGTSSWADKVVSSSHAVTSSYVSTGYGQWYSLQTQTVTANGTSSMTYDSQSLARGFIYDESRIYALQNGVYNLQFSAQFQNTANTNIEIDVWLRQDGVDVPDTNTLFEINKQAGSRGTTVGALNYLVEMISGSYVELIWSSNASTAELYSTGSGINPTRPAVPAIITTITQIA